MSDHTVMRSSDAPDFSGDAPGAFLGYARPMGAEEIAFNVRVLEPGMTNVPPGEDPTRGHSHPAIEELYYVVEGEVTVKCGDDVERLGPRDAVLIPRGVAHMARNEGDAPAVLAMVSPRMEDPRGGSVWHDGFWPT